MGSTQGKETDKDVVDMLLKRKEELYGMDGMPMVGTTRPSNVYIVASGVCADGKPLTYEGNF